MKCLTTALTICLLINEYMTLDIKEINNPILPVQKGEAKTIVNKQTYMYHINITHPLEITENIFSKLISLRNSFKIHNHFSIIMLDKTNQAISLSETIIKKVEIFSKPIFRKRRGLVNGIGKISKWLFGVLDSDDKKHFDYYLKTLKDNQNKIHTDLARSKLILTEMSEKYTKTFNKLSENQMKLQNQIQLLTKEINDSFKIEQAFSFTIIIDNLILQLQNLQNLINNIETAISFAKLHILHSSIIEPNKLKEIIINSNKMHKDSEIPKLNNFMNYYSLFSTQVIIENSMIMFKIHAPLISDTFKYFQLYPVPINNFMITPEYPFLLLNDKDQWTTPENCPEIENFYYCKQQMLQKNQPCLADLIKHGKNHCQGIKVELTETNIQQISSHQVMIIPTEPVVIQAKCETDGIYKISKPSVISLLNCVIEINHKIFRSEETYHEELIFELPILNFNLTPEETHTIRIKNIEHIQHLENLARNLQTTDLQDVPTHHAWSNSMLITILILGSLIYAYFKIARPKLKERRTKNSTKGAGRNSKNRETQFSELNEGGII